MDIEFSYPKFEYSWLYIQVLKTFYNFGIA